MLSAYPQRLRSNRTNPYIQPKGYNLTQAGPEVVRDRQCSGGHQLDPRPERGRRTPTSTPTPTATRPGAGSARPDQAVRLQRRAAPQSNARSRRARSRPRTSRSAAPQESDPLPARAAAAVASCTARRRRSDRLPSGQRVGRVAFEHRNRSLEVLCDTVGAERVPRRTHVRRRIDANKSRFCRALARPDGRCGRSGVRVHGRTQTVERGVRRRQGQARSSTRRSSSRSPLTTTHRGRGQPQRDAPEADTASHHLDKKNVKFDTNAVPSATRTPIENTPEQALAACSAGRPVTATAAFRSASAAPAGFAATCSAFNRPDAKGILLHSSPDASAPPVVPQGHVNRSPAPSTARRSSPLARRDRR